MKRLVDLESSSVLDGVNRAHCLVSRPAPESILSVGRWPRARTYVRTREDRRGAARLWRFRATTLDMVSVRPTRSTLPAIYQASASDSRIAEARMCPLAV